MVYQLSAHFLITEIRHSLAMWYYRNLQFSIKAVFCTKMHMLTHGVLKRSAGTLTKLKRHTLADQTIET